MKDFDTKIVTYNTHRLYTVLQEGEMKGKYILSRVPSEIAILKFDVEIFHSYASSVFLIDNFTVVYDTKTYGSLIGLKHIF